MLTATDELPHRPPEPLPDRWQENYFVLGLDEEQAPRSPCTWNGSPAQGSGGGEGSTSRSATTVVSSTSVHPIERSARRGRDHVSRWSSPSSRWRLRHDGSGRTGRGPQGFVGHGAGPVARLGIDVVLASPLGAIDHADMLRRLALPGTERDHYEACGTWEGRLVAGERDVDGRGSSCATTRGGSGSTRSSRRPGGTRRASTTARATSVARSSATATGSGGYAIVADADGIDATTDVAVRVEGGREEPCGYPATVLTAQFPLRGEMTIAAQTAVHLPHHFPGFADRYYCNDALSTIVVRRAARVRRARAERLPHRSGRWPRLDAATRA